MQDSSHLTIILCLSVIKIRKFSQAIVHFWMAAIVQISFLQDTVSSTDFCC
jgi:hypothetical protein